MYKLDFEIGNYYSTLVLLEEEYEKIEAMTDNEKKSYKLDPRKFNKLHLKHIERCYGEHGQQILKMLP